MSQERKKIERVLPPRPEPKKRVEVVQEVGQHVQVEEVKPEPKKRIVKAEVKKEIPKPEVKEVELVSEDLVIESKRARVKNPDKYLRFSFSELSDNNTISTINRRVLTGEIKYAYYATDNDIGYHYYIIVKK
jgi:hypothetical protein